MESSINRSEGRGRKRRRKDIENVSVNPPADSKTKQKVVASRSDALVGRYVKKQFEGSGVFLGKIVYYDSGLYRIDYEDGDAEDLDSGEVRGFLIGDEDFDKKMLVRKRKLDRLVAKKRYESNHNAVDPESCTDRVIEASALTQLSCGVAPTIEDDGAKLEGYADSFSDSSQYISDRDSGADAETSLAPLAPPPQLPPSSGTIGVPEEYVSHLFSVYSFLRSFSIRLFLSPFTLDDFVGSLNCCVPNTLLDAIHVALMRALRRHLEVLSSDGSEVASKCLRCIDWSLLDSLTWPVYLVQYLIAMGYTEGPAWKGFCADVFVREYYTLSVGRKLMVMQILCDDALDFEELRAEIDMREESEVGIDSDAVTTNLSKNVPRRVHPRYSKTSACKDQEAMDITKSHDIKLPYNLNSLDFDGTKLEANASDVDLDANGDECRICGMDGTLLCCDGCPSAYHSRCIGVNKLSIPKGSWFCPECTISKVGPTIIMGTSLKGAEIFGTDSFEQVFLGSCNHLLVLKASLNTEPYLRYYNQDDIPKVLQALYSSVQYTALYSGICTSILQYWKIPENVLSLPKRVETGIHVANGPVDAVSCTVSFHLPGMENHEVLDMVKGENHATSLNGISVENVAVSSHETMDTVPQTDLPVLQSNSNTAVKQVLPLIETKLPEQIKMEPNMSTSSASQLADPSDLTHHCLADRSTVDFAMCTSGNNMIYNSKHANGVSLPANTFSQINEVSHGVSGMRDRDSDLEYAYMGSSFKSHAYINHYSHGDFAASAAANLAILSVEENRVSQAHASDNRKKVMSADNLLQVKAFSLADIRFLWPSFEKKLVEVPRERCGWCHSCKAPVSSRRGCLLNSAALNATRGAMKIRAGLRLVKSGEGSLPSIATYILFMEESLRGLMVGHFLSASYRRYWRRQVEQASTCSALRSLLLELEENIRIVALSGDWVKLVEDGSVESSVAQSATCAGGTTQKRGPSGRRYRKQSTTFEVKADGCLEKPSSFVWWRGGKLSKLIIQRGILPSSMVKKAAREGGLRKISGIHYTEGSEIPRRSRQTVWRAAVEMSKSVSQLALQVRYLDLHVRWSDLVCPEQNLQDGKGPEVEASAFRNALICDKKVVENKIRYGVAFGNQKHLSSRVMKTIIEMEQSQDGKDTYWFLETRIPLYLIKEYEERVEKLFAPSSKKGSNALSKLQRRQLKASRKDIFSYLERKSDNLDKCSCASCQLDVVLRNAVICSTCQGYCHEDCTVSSQVPANEQVGILITCKQCYFDNKPHTQNENRNDSPTSPLPSQGQEYENPVTVTKSSKHKGRKTVGMVKSSGKKQTPRGSSLTKKERTRISHWGLIYKKKNTEDTGIDFRVKNILLKNSPYMDCSKIVCNLCLKPYNPDLLYVCCETCQKWYHGVALELDESKIDSLNGFKCCKCRRIRSPDCPYMDPEKRKARSTIRRRKPSVKLVQNSDIDSLNGTNSDEQSVEWEPDTPSLPMMEEEEVYIQDDDPLLFSLSRVEQITEQNREVDIECDNNTATGPGPQKLPVRRLVKREGEVDGISGNNEINENNTSPVELNQFLNAKEEASNSQAEWGVGTNGFDDGMMFDYEGFDYEGMEFEPQTYFSVTELLATENPSQEGVPEPESEQYGMDMNNVEMKLPVNLMPCRMCSLTEPATDLGCVICGLWIHSHCSPWVEEPSNSEDGWRCGNCREWR